MPIAYPEVLQLETRDQAFSYTERDTMLYALGVGMGADPLNEKELPFVYENGLKALPTQATVIAWGAGPMGRVGLNYLMVVHGEQSVELHRPLPTEASILADGKVAAVYDKGPKGAVVVMETLIKDARDKSPIATLRSSIFARADGGFGGPSEGAPEPHKIPDRPADARVELSTRPDQALIYRLSGDRNPLHSDPSFARAAGFPRPILHGLCTYGLTCRAVVSAYCDFDPALVRSHAARFSAPVFPGETVIVDLWRDGDVVSFEARVKERDVVVIKGGRSLLA